MPNDCKSLHVFITHINKSWPVELQQHGKQRESLTYVITCSISSLLIFFKGIKYDNKCKNHKNGGYNIADE